MSDPVLARPVASAAVEDTRWRLLLGRYLASIPVRGIGQALEVAAAAAAACGADADGHLRLDVRPERVEIAVQDATRGAVTPRDAQLVRDVTHAVHGLGLAVSPATGAPDRRPAQLLEIAVDAMDIAAVRPFWLAVLGYMDEPSPDADDPAFLPNGIADPAFELPTLWFQQMDEPRPQRNRIHLDLTVAHDEAEARVQRALDAGGVLVSDDKARAFWILADVEGNEVCVCTWQDRDPSA